MRFQKIETNVDFLDYEIPEIPVIQKETPNHYGSHGWKTFPPDIIVVHATAGGSALSSVNWLIKKIARASAHFVIPRYPSPGNYNPQKDQGPVFQLAPLDVATWHAGKSFYDGRSSISRHSYGIELANWQRLIPIPGREGEFRCSYCKSPVNVKIIEQIERNGKTEYWEPFPMEQVIVLARLINMLLDYIASMRNVLGLPNIPVHIVGHEHVSPGRKVDPGPLFPWDLLQSILESTNHRGFDLVFPN